MSVPTFVIPLLLANAPAAASDIPSAGPAVLAAPAEDSPLNVVATPPSGVPPLAPAVTVDGSVPATPPAPPPAATDMDRNAIVVTAHERASPADPLETVNAVAFDAVQEVDKAIIGPVAHGYMKVVPEPMRDGIHNALNNLDEPIVFVNFLLQLKPGKAVETLGRFVINSTIGIGGLVDVAKRKPFHLPRRSNGLADTLGYYGVKPGPYLFLPLIGSTTVRDLLGRVVDLSLVPTAFGKPFNQPTYSLVKGTLAALDERAQNDEQLDRLHNESDDSYLATRKYYLEKRQAEIDVLRGKRSDVPGVTPAAPQAVPVPNAPPATAVPAGSAGAMPTSSAQPAPVTQP